MNRSDAAKKRAAEYLAKDPDYFAKMAARGKGKPAPNRARSVNKELAAKGGRNRGKSTAYQERIKRSQELEELINEGQNENTIFK